MNSRKFFHSLIAILCILLAGFAISSCGDDDEGSDTPPIETKASRVQYVYILSPSQSTLDATDITITYTDADGKEQTEQVTSTSWSKTFTSKALPISFKRVVTVTPKSSVDPSAKYDINIDYGYDCQPLSANGKEIGQKNKVRHTVSASGVSGENLTAYLSTVNKGLSFTTNVAADGTLK